MKYESSPTFIKSYVALSRDVQKKVLKAIKLFQENSRHPDLGIKKLQGAKDIWEGRIDQFYRFTFEYRKNADSGETECWYRNVGRHEIIDRAP